MAGPPPLHYSMQPHLDRKRVQVPPLSHGFELPPPRNRFETPPPGNKLQPLPSGSMPLPSASLCVNQQAPRSRLLQLPLPRDMLRQPPAGRVLQHPTPQNMFQHPPSSSSQLPSPINARFPPSINMHHPPPITLHHPPPIDAQLPPPRSMFQPSATNMQQPPPINMQQPPPINMQQPPPINMQQPPPINMQQPPPTNMQQPPPINMQQPPPINMQQPPPTNMQQPPPTNMQQPPPTNMQQPPPTNMQQPPPTNMQQPPPTNMQQPLPTNIRKHFGNMLQQPHPQSTMKPPGMSEPPPGLLYPPPCTLTSLQSSLELPAPQVSAPPYTPLAGTAPQFGNVQFPPPIPTLHRGKCVPNSSKTPATFLSERRLPLISADRPPPVGKPLPAGGISSDFATSEVFPSSQLFRYSSEITGSENTMSELSHPFINTSSFGMPPSLATTNIDCSVSAANACAISSFVSMPPPVPSLHKVLLSSSVDDKPAHNLAENLAIEIPRHPLNNNWISITKLQSNVDEWLSKKLNSESRDASLDRGDASNNPGNNFPVAQNSVLSYQELEELKKILQESDFNDNERELLSSMLSLLCKQYRDFQLRDVHTCVAAYELLLQRLRGGLGVVLAAAVRKILDRITCILSDEKFQEFVKKLVSARTKKRQRKKKRKQFLRIEWDRKGKLIDARREQLQNLEREKIQELKLRAEADAVLKEVRGKQEEAESLQSLLWTLRDLRQHRLNKGERQGYVSSQQDDDCFNRVTDGLEKMIETQLSDYALEERTLQAMLQSCHPPAATSQSETANSDTVLSAVTEALFGASTDGDDSLYASYCAADTSLEMLIARRRAWDGHIVHHNTDNNSLASSAPSDGASGVPVCWVLPPHDPTPPWRQYLADSK